MMNKMLLLTTTTMMMMVAVGVAGVQICMLVMRQRSLKNVYTQQALLAVLPRLAAFNPTIFSTKSASFIILPHAVP